MEKIEYKFDEEKEIITVKSKSMNFKIPYDKVQKLSYDLSQIARTRKALNPFDDKM